MPLFRRERQAVDPNERSPQLGLKYKDLALLDQLTKAGADLDQPRHVLHYLYFTDAASAEAAAADARVNGFDSRVNEPLPEATGHWGLVCEKHGVVTDALTVRGTTDFFDGIAERHQGEYDGWEASV